MTNDVKKEDLVKRAVELNLGTKEFLDKVQKENIATMIDSVESRDEIIAQVAGDNVQLTKELEASKPVKNNKITTVADIVAAGHIKVVGDGK